MEYTDIDIVGKETHRQQMAFGDVLIPRFVTVLIYLRLFWVFKHSSSKSRSRIRSRNDRKWITQRKTPACQQKNSQIVFKNTRTISKKPKIKRHQIITSTYEREKIHLVDLTSHFRSIKQFTVGSDIFLFFICLIFVCMSLLFETITNFFATLVSWINS